ncbi:MAG: methylmalonyl Co-A mutase-associated GTPase MeaB [Gemmatimonadota bacterium]
MTPSPPLAEADRLLADFAARRPYALARACSIVENQRPGFDALLAQLHPKVGAARRIGLTGPPGAGKSTLTTALAAALRAQGRTVAILAVDPTSPFTGGALLGDRIRMERIALDPGVFIRSMATRGSLGGLAAATREVADVLDAYGFDDILLEPVGVGQTELDIARTADTSVVVLVPESGDSIQTLKAGLMEIADLFVVNKGDRPGADRLRTEIEVMLGMRLGDAGHGVPAHHGVDLRAMAAAERDAARTAMNPARAAREAARADPHDPPAPGGWVPPVLRTVAVQEQGVGERLDAIGRHRAYLEASGGLRERRRARLTERVVEVVERRVRERLWRDAGTVAWLDGQVPALEAGTTTPYHVAEALLARSGDLLARGRT